jgi:hypothetical protein
MEHRRIRLDEQPSVIQETLSNDVLEVVLPNGCSLLNRLRHWFDHPLEIDGSLAKENQERIPRASSSRGHLSCMKRFIR